MIAYLKKINPLPLPAPGRIIISTNLKPTHNDYSDSDGSGCSGSTRLSIYLFVLTQIILARILARCN